MTTSSFGIPLKNRGPGRPALLKGIHGVSANRLPIRISLAQCRNIETVMVGLWVGKPLGSVPGRDDFRLLPPSDPILRKESKCPQGHSKSNTMDRIRTNLVKTGCGSFHGVTTGG